MKNLILIAFLALITLFSAGGASAQDFHCHKAWKKDWKTDKKERKVQRKMFNDHYRKAAKKRMKANRKAYKSDRKEYEHKHGPIRERNW